PAVELAIEIATGDAEVMKTEIPVVQHQVALWAANRRARKPSFGSMPAQSARSTRCSTASRGPPLSWKWSFRTASRRAPEESWKDTTLALSAMVRQNTV